MSQTRLRSLAFFLLHALGFSLHAFLADLVTRSLRYISLDISIQLLTVIPLSAMHAIVSSCCARLLLFCYVWWFCFSFWHFFRIVTILGVTLGIRSYPFISYVDVLYCARFLSICMFSFASSNCDSFVVIPLAFLIWLRIFFYLSDVFAQLILSSLLQIIIRGIFTSSYLRWTEVFICRICSTTATQTVIFHFWLQSVRAFSSWARLSLLASVTFDWLWTTSWHLMVLCESSNVSHLCTY